MKKIVFPIYVNNYDAGINFFGAIPIFYVKTKEEWGERKQAEVNINGIEGFTILVISARNDAEINIVGKQAPEGMWLIDIPVENLDELRSLLVANAIDVTEVREFPWASVAFMTDPFGNKYMLSEK